MPEAKWLLDKVVLGELIRKQSFSADFFRFWLQTQSSCLILGRRALSLSLRELALNASLFWLEFPHCKVKSLDRMISKFSLCSKIAEEFDGNLLYCLHTLGLRNSALLSCGHSHWFFFFSHWLCSCLTLLASVNYQALPSPKQLCCRVSDHETSLPATILISGIWPVSSNSQSVSWSFMSKLTITELLNPLNIFPGQISLFFSLNLI